MRTVMLIGLLSGCVNIRSNGGLVFQDYEGELPERLRSNAQILLSADAPQYGDVPTMVPMMDEPGNTSLYLDLHHLDTDRLWYIQPRGFALTSDSQGLGAMPFAEEWNPFKLLSTATVGSDGYATLWCGEDAHIQVEWNATQSSSHPLATACDTPMRLIPGEEANEVWLLTDRDITRFTADLTPAEVPPLVETSEGLLSVSAIEQVHYALVVEGQVMTVTFQNGSWTTTIGSTPPLVADDITGDPLGEPAVWMGVDRRIRVSTTQGLYAWDILATGQTETLDAAQPPTIDAAWQNLPGRGSSVAVTRIPNPDSSEGLTVPVDIQVRWVDGDDTWVSTTIPTTPCVETDACREIGEFELLGVVAGGGGLAWAVYDMWSWYLDESGTNIRAVVATPIDVE